MILVDKLLDYSLKYKKSDVLFFTANQVVKHNGELVMGAGNAKAARDAIRGSAMAFGEQLMGRRLLILKVGKVKLGALVTKVHFRDSSDLKFVIKSINKLRKHANNNPEVTYHVPYPAIGFGGLTKSQLDVHVSRLPDNVLIYCNTKEYTI